ncbi:MAG: VOC family protein [Rhodobiaceae bacterium]|nr:VOC family protein [Rhodobiaceae bacterium]
MEMKAIDHIVLCAEDVSKTRDFYVGVLNMEAREERPGKWSLHFGTQKISLQQAGNAPSIAERTTPGTGNFCLLTETPLHDVLKHLQQHNVEIIDGPVQRIGATGTILSVYFYDPDGALVEIANVL